MQFSHLIFMFGNRNYLVKNKRGTILIKTKKKKQEKSFLVKITQ